jgi:hypothetical protein
MIGNNTAFLDLMFNLLLGFVFLFFISFLMIKPMVKKADSKNNAEYVISTVWPDGNKDDVDTWLQDPTGEIVWFNKREQNFSHLDRDDMGQVNDTLTLADGSVVENLRNQELVTLRGYIPGEWVLNVHAYKRREVDPTPVTVSIDKINPNFRTVFLKEVVLSENWQEITVTRFDMTPQGEILSFDPLPKQLVLSETIFPTSDPAPYTGTTR